MRESTNRSTSSSTPCSSGSVWGCGSMCGDGGSLDESYVVAVTQTRSLVHHHSKQRQLAALAEKRREGGGGGH